MKGEKALYRKRSAGGASAIPDTGRSLWSGVLMGFGAITMMENPIFAPPRYTGDGLRGDWRAVGSDIRNAMQRRDEHKKA